MLGILVLIIANGLFSMSEIALVSSRRARLQQRAEEGDLGAKYALELADEPENFLSTVQIGITLIGVLMGAFGGAQIATQLEPILRELPLVGAYSNQVSLFLVVGLITYLSLVLGELAPKQIGLSNPERVSGLVARPMQILARVTAPLVLILAVSTRFVIWLLRVKPSDEPPVTEAELQILMEQGAESGVIEPIEEEIVGQIFRVGDKRVNEIMIDRTDVVWLDVNDDPQTILQKVENGIHSRYPVADGSLDQLVGVVFSQDLLIQSLKGEGINLKAKMNPPLLIPSGLPVYEMLGRFREAMLQIAFVTDEHGGIKGLVTFNDLLEEIVGDVPEIVDPEEPTAVIREDGSWLVDGRLPISAFKDLLSLKTLPGEADNYYTTVGGFVMTTMGRVPEVGDVLTWDRYRIEVLDMDWRRVDKVLVKENELSPGSSPPVPTEETIDE